MKWVKYLLVLLAGLLLGSALIMAASILILEESDYKRLLGWGAERFLDSQLVIEGPLEIEISRNLSVSSGNIFLKADDDSYQLSIGKLHASFRLGSYLQTGTFLFNNLQLEDIKLEVKETAEDDDFSFKDFKIPPVAIVQAQFTNVAFIYQELSPGTLHTLLLDELAIGELGEHQPISLNAKGLFEGQPFVLQGTSDSIAHYFERQNPFSFNIELSSVDISAKLQGSIADPINGRGLDLKFQTDVSQVRDIIEIIWDEIPILGSLRGSLAIRGDYTAPRLEAIDLHLQRNQEVELMIKGSVENISRGEGVDLQLNGMSSNPQVLSWLLSNLLADIQTAQIARFGKQLNYALPELGSARLHGKLVSQGSELILQDAKLNIGIKGQLTLHASGLLATQLRDPKNFRIAMDVNIQASELAQLAKPFDYKLPELGPTHITGWLEFSESELHFKDGLLVVGTAGQPTIRTDFKLTTKLRKGSTINAKFDMAAAQLIAAFSDMQPKNLGRLQGDAMISNLDGDWGIENFSLASTQTNLYQLQLSGKYDDMENFDEANVNASLIIDSPTSLGEALSIDLSGLGAFRLQGLVNSKKGRMFYDGKMSLGSTNSKTEISSYLKDGKPVFEGSVNIPVLYLADFGFGSPGKDESELSKDKSAIPHVFSRKSLDFEFLNDVDFDLLVSIDEVESEKFRIDSIEGQLELENGHLIAPLRLVFEAGNTNINLDIRMVALPEYQLSINSDDVSLGPLMSQVTDEIPIQGYSNIQLDLHTRGKTLHEMASSLSGNVDIELENIRIPKKYVELLSVDIFGWALSKSLAKKSHHNLNCVVLKFAVNAGEVESKAIIADGPNMSLGGKIDMNLDEETLDIVLIPKEKKRFFASSTPVKVHGPMKKPKVDAIPAKVAIQEIGAMTLLPGVFIPLRAGEKLWSLLSDGDKVGGGCENIDALREFKNK